MQEQTCEDTNLKNFTESLNDGLYITNEKGVFIYSNTGLARILGCEKPDQIVGRSFIDFLEQLPREELLKKYEEFTQTGIESPVITTQIIRMDGSIGVIEIKPGKPGVSGYSRGVVRDITDIRKTQQLLKETEIRYQSIVELSPDAIVLATVEGAIIEFNEKALRLFNYQHKNEVIGLWIGSFVDPNEQIDMQTLLVDAIQNGERLYAEVSLLRSDK